MRWWSHRWCPCEWTIPEKINSVVMLWGTRQSRREKKKPDTYEKYMPQVSTLEVAFKYIISFNLYPLQWKSQSQRHKMIILFFFLEFSFEMGSYCVCVPGLLGTLSPSTSDRRPFSRLVNESQEGLTTEARAACDGNCEMEGRHHWQCDRGQTNCTCEWILAGAKKERTEGDRRSN